MNTVVITSVPTPGIAFTFAVTAANGDTATFHQSAVDQNTAIDQLVAELAALSAAATAQKV